MAEFMVIEEEEEIHTCVFQERENSLDTMSDAQLVREYRFVQEVPCLTSSPVSVDRLEFFACGTFQSVVGDVFKVHKSTVCRVVYHVASALCRCLDSYSYTSLGSCLHRAFLC